MCENMNKDLTNLSCYMIGVESVMVATNQSKCGP